MLYPTPTPYFFSMGKGPVLTNETLSVIGKVWVVGVEKPKNLRKTHNDRV